MVSGVKEVSHMNYLMIQKKNKQTYISSFKVGTSEENMEKEKQNKMASEQTMTQAIIQQLKPPKQQ